MFCVFSSLLLLFFIHSTSALTIPLQNFNDWAIPMTTKVSITAYVESNQLISELKLVPVPNSCYSIISIPAEIMNMTNESTIRHNIFNDH